MASKLHYLTVQDILWINLQVTKQVNAYNFANLEEATFYQYAYNEDPDVVRQAASFLKGFLAKQPFDAGNEATALVGCFSFLRINGFDVNLSDGEAIEWFRKVQNGTFEAQKAVKEVATESLMHHYGLVPDIRGETIDVMRSYASCISDLTGIHLQFPADGAIH
jgi:prophage maintenance system killer protein